MSTDYELEAAAREVHRLFEHEPISLGELQDAIFQIRDRLWAGDVDTEPEPPLRLRGWRGRAHEQLSQLLELKE
jgi:hypothetical protein